MRGELRVDRLPTKMLNNRVMVGVEDTFEGFETQAGISLVNLTESDSWADSNQYNISEFVMRHGKVLLVPDVITKGSFNYETGVEIQPGDMVFWNLISFQDHIPLLFEKKLYLLVDYHEILARKRGDVITPVNGYGLFSSVAKEVSALQYKIRNNVSDEWILEALPDHNVIYNKHSRTPATCWKVGDKVRLLVMSSPFKLEGTIRKSLDKDLYACPINFIICTV